jgi:hypothetical protein
MGLVQHMLIRALLLLAFLWGQAYANLLLTIEHQQNIRHAVDMAKKECALTALPFVT